MSPRPVTRLTVENAYRDACTALHVMKTAGLINPYRLPAADRAAVRESNVAARREAERAIDALRAVLDANDTQNALESLRS